MQQLNALEDLYGLYTGVAAGYGLLVLLYAGSTLPPEVVTCCDLDLDAVSAARHRLVSGLGQGWIHLGRSGRLAMWCDRTFEDVA